MARYRYDLNVYEQPHRYPETIEQSKENLEPRKLAPAELPPGKSEIQARNPDDAMRQAREVVAGMGRAIRSVSIGPEGLHVVVYRVEQSKMDPRTMSEKRRRYG